MLISLCNPTLHLAMHIGTPLNKSACLGFHVIIDEYPNLTDAAVVSFVYAANIHAFLFPTKLLFTFFPPLCAEISDEHQVADDVVGDEQCFAREFQSVAAEF